MNELLIILAIVVLFIPVAMFAYSRGRKAGISECKREYFSRTYLRGYFGVNNDD